MLELDDTDGMQFVSLGVDVARFGDDETIIYRNYHGHCKIVRKQARTEPDGHCRGYRTGIQEDI